MLEGMNKKRAAVVLSLLVLTAVVVTTVLHITLGSVAALLVIPSMMVVGWVIGDKTFRWVFPNG